MRPKFHLPVLGYAFRITGVMNDSIAKLEKRFSLEPGSRGFFDFESNLLRLKNTHVADCSPQAPPGRRWDFALELGLGRFLQIKLGPAKTRSFALKSGPRATSSFGKKHGLKNL